jgi:hypothetical protein
MGSTLSESGASGKAGAVHYRLGDKPMFIQCCHCRNCQKQSGGPFVINGMIERDRIEITAGAPTPHEMKTDSGYPHDIWRCDDCGSALWSDYGRRGTLVFLRVTTLDAPLTPDAHIFTRSKLPWVSLPEGMRAFEIYYDMQKEWAPESLARRAALNLAR